MFEKRKKMFTGHLEFLSNFYESWVPFRGRYYPSVENAYQEYKVSRESPDRKFDCYKGMYPAEAKKEANGASKTKEVYDRIALMEELVTAKFSRPDMADRLLAVPDECLTERNEHGDTFWGVCGGVGEDNLGKILLKVKRGLEDHYVSPKPLRYIRDNLLDPKYRDKYSFLHSINSMSTWGAGFAVQATTVMRDLYQADLDLRTPSEDRPGTFLYVDRGNGRYDIGIFGQHRYGPIEDFFVDRYIKDIHRRRITASYRLQWLDTALKSLSEHSERFGEIAMPLIGSGLGRSPWFVIEGLIRKYFPDNVTVFIHPSNPYDPNPSKRPPVVVNRHHEKYDLYIGRGTIYGNPVKITDDCSREDAISLGEQQFWKDFNEGLIDIKDIEYLAGKKIGCSCKPEPCHGDYLVEAYKLLID